MQGDELRSQGFVAQRDVGCPMLEAVELHRLDIHLLPSNEFRDNRPKRPLSAMVHVRLSTSEQFARHLAPQPPAFSLTCKFLITERLRPRLDSQPAGIPEFGKWGRGVKALRPTDVHHIRRADLRQNELTIPWVAPCLPHPDRLDAIPYFDVRLWMVGEEINHEREVLATQRHSQVSIGNNSSHPLSNASLHCVDTAG